MTHQQWDSENTEQFKGKYSFSTGIPQAFHDAMRKTGKTKSAYLRDAIVESLIADGCNPANYRGKPIADFRDDLDS